MSGCIEQYVLLAKNARGAALQHLVSQALEDASVFVFGELMSLPNIKELQNSPEGLPYWNLLQLFAYETYNKYLAALAQNQVPALSENQIHKLRQLTIATFAAKLKRIPYKLLLDELGMANKRQLEDLIIEAMYANIVTGKLDQKNELLEVEACMGRDVKMEDLKANAKLLNDWLAQCGQIMEVIGTQMAIANLTKADAVKQKARNEQEYLNLKKTLKIVGSSLNAPDLDDQPMDVSSSSMQQVPHDGDKKKEKRSRMGGYGFRGTSKLWKN